MEKRDSVLIGVNIGLFGEYYIVKSL